MTDTSSELSDSLRAGDVAKGLLFSHTPSAMSEETLEAVFVQREPLLRRLVDNIRDSATTQAKRHALLIGPRGMGKTHLIALVYHRVRREADLRKRLCIAWLSEDLWEVASYTDLLESILRTLATEYRAADLKAIADSLIRLSEREAAEKAERALLDFIGDCTLLLLMENLYRVFDALGEEGQHELRAFLENHNNCVVVATATSLFDEVSRHDKPFYGFFNTTTLRELKLEDARELLQKVAQERGDTGLTTFLTTDTAARRLRVVEALAGGHPRIWVMFADCITEPLLDKLIPLFLKMLDDLTPYYQDRMQHLKPQQRKIVSYVCAEQGAVPVGQIAEGCRIKLNVASVQLKELETKGYIRKAEKPSVPSRGDARVSYYEMREPLMRLCLEVKEARDKPIRLIVDFLRHWYDRDELEKRLSLAPTDAHYERLYLRAALLLMASSPNFEGTTLEELEATVIIHMENALLNVEATLQLLPASKTLLATKGALLRLLGRQSDSCTLLNHASDLQTTNKDEQLLTNIMSELPATYHKVWDDLLKLSEEMAALPVYWFEMTKFYFARQEADKALNALKRGLETSQERSCSEKFAAGYANLFCKCILEQNAYEVTWSDLLMSLINLYADKKMLNIFSNGATLSISILFALRITDDKARKWLDAWEVAGKDKDELQIPLRLLRTAVEWRETRQEAVLLRLPVEERRILEELLPKE